MIDRIMQYVASKLGKPRVHSGQISESLKRSILAKYMQTPGGRETLVKSFVMPAVVRARFIDKALSEAEALATINGLLPQVRAFLDRVEGPPPSGQETYHPWFAAHEVVIGWLVTQTIMARRA